MKFYDHMAIRILLLVARYCSTDEDMKKEIRYIANAIQCRLMDEEREAKTPSRGETVKLTPMASSH